MTDYFLPTYMDKETTKREDGVKVYEIGYLIVPSVPAEKVEAEVSAIKSLITKQKGQFIAEEFPQLRPLAYTMAKQVGSSRQKFDEGYFGWIKFELDVAALPEIKEAMDINEKVLRYLLINTVKENTYLGQKALPKEEGKTEVETDASEKKEDDSSSVEEIDKTIDSMVKES